MKQVLRLTAALLLMGNLHAQTTLLDFETAGTSTTYQYFGSTLDGTLNNIIANPDASGINTSSMVADHVKPAGSQTWAGAFPSPALPIAADMASNNLVCLKVWFPQPGNLGVKLEGSGTGDNWVRTVDVAQTQTWAEVCLDAGLPSIEAPFLPATGHIYPTVTLFFNFGVSPAADITYYWDDLLVKTGSGASPGDITFSVDMNDYAGSFTTVYVSGTFNNWSGDSNPLDDSDGDGVWTATVADVPAGLHEYKFTVDNWAAQEEFNGFETCVQVDPSGQFVNRRLVVAGDAALPTVCWNSCYTCGNAVNITIELGSSNITVSPEGLFVAGGGNFGIPGDFPLSDDDGDGIWTATFERPLGFESFFTFTNGACPDYSCKENIEGQDCADPANFNDRKMGPVTQDTTISTCFGICTTDTDCGGNLSGDVTFQVDMSSYTGAFTTAFIAGNFNNWSGDANPLDDSDGDGIWETTINLQPGTYEYKFELDNWAVDEQFTDGDPCTVTDPSGTFVNRVIEVNGDQTVCFEWNTCTSCLASSTGELAFDETLFTVSPSLVRDFTTVFFNQNLREAKTLRLFGPTGLLVREFQIEAGATEQRISTSELGAGIYLIYAQSGNRIATKKIVKQ